ncbi:DUF2637 domain-containing protein [Streptomyces albidoflavus]|uniref:DUF2637 domain-containing protein n=1 Tax=Streptomyces albidoflavus TaxID=1886 RepID=UPI0038CF9ADA
MSTTLHPHDPQPPEDQIRETQQTKRADPEQYALVAAGIVIIALTIGAFWLSYAHLADIAGQHGLGTSPVRRWAWPATLDAFIIAGELLMLRAALQRVTDPWAIAVTGIGSVGSIALNVAGVSDTGNVPFLDYVVAAVPPAAAMVAFGVLMRQIHQLVERPVQPLATSSDHQPELVHPMSVPGPDLPVTVGRGSAEAAPTIEIPSSSDQVQELPAAASECPPEASDAVAEDRQRGGRPPGAPIEDLVEIGRGAAAEQGKLTRFIVRTAIEDEGLTIGSKRLTQVMEILRTGPELAAENGSQER